MVYISIFNNRHKNHPPINYHKKLQQRPWNTLCLQTIIQHTNHSTTTNHPPLTNHHPAPNPQTTINQPPSTTTINLPPSTNYHRTTNQTTTSHQHMQTITHYPHQPSSPFSSTNHNKSPSNHQPPWSTYHPLITLKCLHLWITTQGSPYINHHGIYSTL